MWWWKAIIPALLVALALVSVESQSNGTQQQDTGSTVDRQGTQIKQSNSSAAAAATTEGAVRTTSAPVRKTATTEARKPTTAARQSTTTTAAAKGPTTTVSGGSSGVQDNCTARVPSEFRERYQEVIRTVGANLERLDTSSALDKLAPVVHVLCRHQLKQIMEKLKDNRVTVTENFCNNLQYVKSREVRSIGIFLMRHLGARINTTPAKLFFKCAKILPCSARFVARRITTMPEQEFLAEMKSSFNGDEKCHICKVFKEKINQKTTGAGVLTFLEKAKGAMACLGNDVTLLRKLNNLLKAVDIPNETLKTLCISGVKKFVKGIVKGVLSRRNINPKGLPTECRKFGWGVAIPKTRADALEAISSLPKDKKTMRFLKLKIKQLLGNPANFGRDEIRILASNGDMKFQDVLKLKADTFCTDDTINFSDIEGSLSAVAEKCKGTFGKIGSAWLTDKRKKLIAFAQINDLKQVADADLLKVVEAICDSTIRPAVRQAMAGKVEDYLKKNNYNKIADKTIKCVYPLLSKETQGKTPKEKLAEVCSNALDNDNDAAILADERLNNLKDAFKEKVTIPACPRLLASYNETDITGMSKEDLKENIGYLTKNVGGCKALAALANRYKEIVPLNAVTTGDDLITYGKMLMTSDISSLKADVQCTAFDTLVERLDEVAKIAKLRKKVQSDDKYSCLLGSDVYDKIVAAAKACKPQESRRKRSGFVLTCETIKSSTPDALRGWSVADLNTLTKTEFENCQSELGAGNFSASQFEALAVMAETHLGDSEQWNEETLTALAGIVAGLTVEKINKLNLTFDSAVQQIGDSKATDHAKLTALFERYLSSKSIAASGLTSLQLNLLGELLCGGKDSHIADISKDAFSGCNIEDVGNLMTCSSHQWKKLAEKAVAVHGEPGQWSTGLVANVGHIVGGLSKAQLATLNEYQLKEVSTATIQNMDHITFAGFTNDQLSKFSLGQANSVTSEQMGALDGDRRETLNKIKDPNHVSDKDDDDSGSPGSAVSCVILALGLLLTHIAY